MAILEVEAAASATLVVEVEALATREEAQQVLGAPGEGAPGLEEVRAGRRQELLGECQK